MSREIEADYVAECGNENHQCEKCDSYYNGYCNEIEMDVSPIGSCDFFRSKN